MSLQIEFKDNVFALNSIKLPSRYYYFNETENFIKLVTIGEGVFPKDRVKQSFLLNNSNAIVTTQASTKVYPSKKEFGINYLKLSLKNSNLEYINDELILFKDAKFIQLLRLEFCEKSTFFYSEILSSGRSGEFYDFDTIFLRNKFFKNKELEYIDNLQISGKSFRKYIDDFSGVGKALFLKLYIKASNNESMLELLHENDFTSFTFSKNKNMIIGLLSANSMIEIKKYQERLYRVYRKNLNKGEFNLSK